jgi:hypothetical protein
VGYQVTRALGVEPHDGETRSQRFEHDLAKRLGETGESENVRRGVARSEFRAGSVTHEDGVVALLLADRLELHPRRSVAHKHEFRRHVTRRKVGRESLVSIQEEMEVLLP